MANSNGFVAFARALLGCFIDVAFFWQKVCPSMLEDDGELYSYVTTSAYGHG